MKCDHSKLQFFFPGLSISPGKPRQPEGLGEVDGEITQEGAWPFQGLKEAEGGNSLFNRYSAILTSGLKSPSSPKEEIKRGFIS